jgi:type I restriction-modification system DNA methylase subunit
MPLFQESIIQKYCQTQNKALVAEKWNGFKKHFLNPAIQANIRGSKEEQYQEGFLIDLFVKILGYIKNPNLSFNLTTELKNVNDNRKVDGAIIIQDKVFAVIELKGMDTTELKNVEGQAFAYKNNQKDCIYVISSNFQKLRLYIDDAVEYIEFDLFNLDEKQFLLLYTCLAFDNIRNHVPKRMKTESLSQEDVITKRLYKDYTSFREDLYQNLVKLNPHVDSVTLFKQTQKLLSRFLFIFFAEDKNLLQPNSIRSVTKYWKTLKNWENYKTLYAVYQKFFDFLQYGIKNEELDVFPYNGGLFQADAMLNNLLIDDAVLYKHTLKLSEYNFDSEVDVNILGHIFENSLNEIDEVKAKLDGTTLDKTQTKRKKDGIFYTPKYITQYMIENTVGKLCKEQKEILQLFDKEYITDKKRKKTDTQKLLDKLKTYRNWLLELTIIDPACGSGAFLNEALNFLIAEHEYIDELQAKLLGDSLMLSEVEKSILENNLFGVDLNEESVEIAKLSLWLRTAKPNRKLNDLNNNIKCGNSLIDSAKIAGEKAFVWKNEFPKIFEKGGFDVVIGNPPYVQLQSRKELSESLAPIGYQTYEKTGDLYCLFYEQGNNLLKENGLLAYITSNKWLRANYGKSLRNYFLENIKPILLVDLGSNIFESATVDSNILIFEKQKLDTIEEFVAMDLSKEKNFEDFMVYENRKTVIKPKKDEAWIIVNDLELEIKRKVEKIGTPLKNWNIEIYRGIITGFNDAFVIDEYTKNALIQQDANSAEIIKPLLRGRDIQRYYANFAGLYLINSHNGYKDIPRIDIDKYPAIKNHLDKYYAQLAIRQDKGFTPYNLRNCAYLEDFEKEKIIYPNMTSFLPFTYDTSKFYSNDKSFIITGESLKYLVCFLNSKLFKYCFSNNFPSLGEQGRELRKVFFEQIAIKKLSLSAQQPFIEKADMMLTLQQDLQILLGKIERSILREFKLQTLSTKLQHWYLLSFAEFLEELARQKIKLKTEQKLDWEEFFANKSQKANELLQAIRKTDQEIDKLVYELYELTTEEILIIEQA